MRTSQTLSRLTALVAGLGLLASGSVSGALAEPAPAVAGSSGIGDRYFPADGNGGIDVLSYRIKQRWKPRARVLTGTTTLRLTTTQHLSSFNLDFMLPVQSVQVDGRAARFVKPTTHELRITPASTLPQGSTVTVRVRYSGKPLKARYRGETGFTRTPGGTVMAVNEPHAAAFWFPVNDHPRDRATVDVTTTVPRGQQVVGNGLLISKATRQHTTTWRWAATEPMAPYLAYFVAGRMELTRTQDAAGRPVFYAASKEIPTRQRKRAMRAVRQTPRITAWLEKELQRPYPWNTNGGVLVPDLGFALENQTRPVYSPWSSMGTVVVHELAHQWFGDAVTVNRWQDIWLNEGFASYLEMRWEEANSGFSTRQSLTYMYDVYRDLPSFWRVAPGAPGATKIFDQAVYQRGAMTLAALRVRIGDADMKTLLTQWLAQASGRSARVEEFIALAEEVSGEDLDSFFDAWLYTRKAPARTALNGLR